MEETVDNKDNSETGKLAPKEIVKSGIINFFKNLKHFFTPLGVLALGLIFGFSVFIPGAVRSFGTLVESVKRILTDTTADLASLKDGALYAVGALDWSRPITAIKTMLSGEWLMQLLNDFASAFAESVEAYAAQFNVAVNAFTHDLVAYLAVVIVFAVIGLIAGFFLTRWLARRSVKIALWKYMLSCIVDTLLAALFVVFMVWLMTVWASSIIISAFVAILLFGFISVAESYIVHALNKTSAKKVFEPKSVLMLLLTDIIIFVIAALCVALLTLITNVIVGIFIGIVFMEITFITIGYNAEEYVISVVTR